MTNPANFNDSERFLDRIARCGSASVPEPLRTTSPGARQSIWSAKVLSNTSYNLYSVALVKLNQPGQTPTQLDTQMQAFNLAESFTSQGSLSAGTYVVISRVGDKNIFYAPV